MSRLCDECGNQCNCDCNECGENLLNCECYVKCKCNKHPFTHENAFEMKGSVYGIFDEVLFEDFEASCKICNEKFKFSKINGIILR